MSTRPAPWFRRLAVTTAVVTYLLIIVGGIVRVTGSGDGCGSSGGWPLCNGSLLPALRTTTLIEFSHRWVTTLTTVLVAALVLSAWLSQRERRRIVAGATLAGVLLVVQIVLGAVVVEFDLPGGIVMIHLANALLLLGVLVFVAVTATRTGAGNASSAPPLLLRRLTTFAAAATYLLALSGALVVETGSSGGCDGWPLCGGGFQLPASQMDVIDMVHRVVAGVVVLLIGAVMAVVIRRARDDRALRRAAMFVNVAVLLQIAAGALVVVLRLPAAVQGLHIALASLLWATVVAVAVMTRSRQTAPVTETGTVTSPRAEALRPGMVST
ncbi:MAG: COX15/CtaA family protein [Candidatus Dormibacteraeota bacterium]|nr:COX15/CtaA family protein [Candidatus Dormibacteraeota bacterium]